MKYEVVSIELVDREAMTKPCSSCSIAYKDFIEFLGERLDGCFWSVTEDTLNLCGDCLKNRSFS